MSKKKHRKSRRPRRSSPPALTLVSIPRGGPTPGRPEFLAETDAWLEELRADFRRSTGAELGGGNGVLFAHDVLCELFGDEASWQRFDVGSFERWVRTHAAPFSVVLPVMIADLACFTNLLARRGRIAPERAEETMARMLELACGCGAGAPNGLAN